MGCMTGRSERGGPFPYAPPRCIANLTQHYRAGPWERQLSYATLAEFSHVAFCECMCAQTASPPSSGFVICEGSAEALLVCGRTRVFAPRISLCTRVLVTASAPREHGETLFAVFLLFYFSAARLHDSSRHRSVRWWWWGWRRRRRWWWGELD